MNAKQFVNSGIVAVFRWCGDRWPRLRRGSRVALDLFFPRFVRLPVPDLFGGRASIRSMIAAYVVIVVVLAGVQGLWAALNGTFLPDDNLATRTFLEDHANLINYLILVPAYCLLGYAFLTQSYRTRSLLVERGVPIADRWDGVNVFRKGILGACAVLVIAFIGISVYAVEAREYRLQFWFMSSAPPNAQFGAAGFYYLFTNVFLLVFILWVAFSHFELARLGSDLAGILDRVIEEGDDTALREWEENDVVRSRLAPFSSFIVTSKFLVLTLFLNMLTWRLNEPSVTVMYGLGVLFVAVFGIWVFSLPRYSVQFRLFRIHERLGHQEYVDIRLPWAKGASAFVDVVLFSFLLSYLLGDVRVELLEKLFS